MTTYSVGEAAKALNVSDGTIRNWTENKVFEVYLSNVATRTGAYKDAKERRYSETDLHVLNTIRVHKVHGIEWDEVADILERGIREKDLPASAMLTLPETRGEAFQTVSVLIERTQALDERVKELEAMLQDKEDKLLETTKQLMQERGDLHEELGALKFILKRHGIDPETGEKKSDN
ncbi:MAG: MerR family transcriptional regulator [Phototrophicaceae bacterium]